MNPTIRPSFSSASPSPVSPPPTPAQATAPPVPVDTFAGSTEVTPEDAMRALRTIQKVEKQGRSFNVADRALAPDGSLYVAYKDWITDGPGYVSATRKDGSISWEAPCEGVRAIRVTPDGVLHAITKNEHICFSPDGAELGRTPLPSPPLSKAWISPDGAVVGLDQNQRLVGAPADAPGGEVTDFAPQRDSLRVRVRGEWAELDGAHVLQRRTVPPNRQDGKIHTSVDEVFPLPDGGTLLKTRQTVEMRAPFPMAVLGSTGYPAGALGSAGYGPMMDPDPGEYITHVHLRRLDASGAKRWETDSLGDSSRVAVAPDGTAYATVESGGQGRLLRFGADGKREDMGPLKPPSGGLVVEGDAVVASDANGLAVLQGGALQIVPDTKAWRGVAGLGDGRVFLTDYYNKTAALLDLATQRVQPITDPVGDHSEGRLGEIMKQARASGSSSSPPPTVIVGDDSVQIGGVRVERNKTTPR